ncbi:hydroxyacid dehydrogenase [Eubacteriales bacterium OttesenSCG-928-N14]|nr:hydroxyacid dehydrogenase [Eubacteriales bacterium OttesenSCG-928-N14]
MYQVLIPQDIPQIGKDYLTEHGYSYRIGSGHDIETIKREIVDADAIIVRTALYPREVIEAGKKLRVIARFGVGTDNIDIAAATERGIYVTIAKDANAVSVAEHAIMFMLTLARSLTFMDKEVHANHWDARNSHPIYQLSGKTLGILGAGAIGRETARIAHDGFGMRIIAYDPYCDTCPEYITLMDDLDSVLAESDFVSLHMPANEATTGIINERTLGLMKPSAYLINCGRGQLVDEAALCKALQQNIIAGAAADVLCQEPPEQANPLLGLGNFIASPHNAGITVESSDAMALMAAQAVDDILSGRQSNYAINHLHPQQTVAL